VSLCWKKCGIACFISVFNMLILQWNLVTIMPAFHAHGKRSTPH
jgi:hypothetical protein